MKRRASRASDGIRSVEEDVLDAEALAHELGRRAHSERLGRVVARAHDGDAELARERPEVLLRLAR